MYDQLRMDRATTTASIAFINVLRNMGVISQRRAIDYYAAIFTRHHSYVQDMLAGISDRPLAKGPPKNET